MKGVLLLIISIVLFATATNARAAVMSRDWKTPGDGLLTYDDVNRREWLDLSQTNLSRFPGTTAYERYLAIVDATAPGEIFEGFMTARSIDVIALAESAGIDTTSSSFAMNSVPALQLGELLSFTRVVESGNKSAIGILDFESPSAPRRLYSVIYVDIETQPNGRAGLLLIDNVLAGPLGVMLYRVVPEPQASLLAFFGLSMIVWVEKRARNGAHDFPSSSC
jgi:hypothetical protein